MRRGTVSRHGHRGPHVQRLATFCAACGSISMQTSRTSLGSQALYHRLALQAVDAVFPPVCLICGRVSEAFCPACRATITGEKDAPAPPGVQAIRVVGFHQAALRSAVLRLKFEGKTALAAPLGELLAAELQHMAPGWKPDILVPIPIHWWRAAERGFNQAELLAEVVGRSLHLPVARALARIRSTGHQVGLTADERRRNLADAFALDPRHSVRGRNVVLVDDVFTTGATMAACAAILRDAGAQVFGLAVSLER